MTRVVDGVPGYDLIIFRTYMEEGLVPHAKRTDDAGIEEERRLAYVGITRAQRELLIKYADRHQRFGEFPECERPRFLRGASGVRSRLGGAGRGA